MADALSQNPTLQPDMDDEHAESDLAGVIGAIRAMQAEESGINLQIQEVHKHADHDQEYQDLMSLIHEGFPAMKAEMPQGLKPYWSVRDKLTVDEGLIVKGCRLLIPKQLRYRILQRE